MSLVFVSVMTLITSHYSNPVSIPDSSRCFFDLSGDAERALKLSGPDRLT